MLDTGDGVGTQRHASAALTQAKRPGIHCTGSWVGPWAGLDGSIKSHPQREWIPEPANQWRVAKPAELYHIRYICYGVLCRNCNTGTAERIT